MSSPFFPAKPGDTLLSQQWNELQIRLRDELLSHTHAGGEQGTRIAGDGIDPASTLTVKSLGVTELLTLGNPVQLIMEPTGRVGIGVMPSADSRLSVAGGIRTDTLQVDNVKTSTLTGVTEFAVSSFHADSISSAHVIAGIVEASSFISTGPAPLSLNNWPGGSVMAGSLGLGVVPTGAPLQFDGSAGDKLLLWDGASPDRFGLGAAASNLSVFVPDGGYFSVRGGAFSGGPERFSVTGSGNVGVGTIQPESALHIERNVAGALGAELVLANKAGGLGAAVSIAFGTDSTSIAGGAGNAQLKVTNMDAATNRSELSFLTFDGAALKERLRLIADGALVTGNLTTTGSALWGPTGNRTETRNDAGQAGTTGARSGFFQADTPVNYPAGATSFWHLLDVRQTNTASNYALQLAGSFYDQQLFFRKTNNNPAQGWLRLLSTADLDTRLSIAGVVTGSLGFGITPTSAPLQFANSAGDKIMLWDSATGNRLGLGVTSSVLSAFVPDSGYFSVRSGASSSGPDRFVVLGGGKVGIGTNAPEAPLHIEKNAAGALGAELVLANKAGGTNAAVSISFGTDNTTAANANGNARLKVINMDGTTRRSEMSFLTFDGTALSERLRLIADGALVTGNLTATSSVGWGPSGTRTETRNDAGLPAASAARSGFFQADTPVNFPGGATSFWHLLDVRNSNPASNYAMQLAGSFYDQQLFFRKTNNNAAQSWLRVLTSADLTSGVVASSLGIGVASTPASGTLQLASSAGDKLLFWDGTSADRYGLGVAASNLTAFVPDGARFSVRSGASSTGTERLVVTGAGNVGVGTSSPESLLHIEKSVASALGAELVLANKAGGTGAAVSISFGTDSTSVANGSGNAQLTVTNMDGSTNRSEMSFVTFDGTGYSEHLRLLADGALVTGNLTATGNVSAAGSVSANSVSAAGSVSASSVSAAGSVNANSVNANSVNATGNVSAAGNVTATGTAAWGTNATRTETRNDAGLMGSAGARSGFFQTDVPVNYPAGAVNQWLLLDVRHSNPANNYAMQFAGSHYDQQVWFRKTNNNAAQSWLRLLTTADLDAGLTLNGALVPKVGNAENAGIMFPKDPAGGSGDLAYLRYFASSGELCKLVLGIENDANDTLVLRQSGADRISISNGAVTVDSATKLYVGSQLIATSDRRKKRDITPIEGALEKLLRVRGVRFFWAEPSRPQEPELGVLAQDVEAVFPEVVAEDAQGVKGVDYTRLVAPLIEAVREQQAQIEALRAEVRELKERR